jgi:hypothetical protein
MQDAFDFEVGGRYRNRRGTYQVMAIDLPAMQIQYDDGDLATVDLATQRRIFLNMREEEVAREVAAQKEASRPVRATRRQPRQKLATGS